MLHTKVPFPENNLLFFFCFVVLFLSRAMKSFCWATYWRQHGFIFRFFYHSVCIFPLPLRIAVKKQNFDCMMVLDFYCHCIKERSKTRDTFLPPTNWFFFFFFKRGKNFVIKHSLQPSKKRS